MASLRRRRSLSSPLQSTPQRRSIRCLLMLPLVLLAGLLPAVAQDMTPAPISGKPVPSLAQLDTIMQTYMSEYNSPGASLSVAVNGKLVFARGYGYAVQNSEYVQPDSLFRIASNSKPFTAAGILKLIQQGKLTMDTKPFAGILSDLTGPPGSTEDPRYNDITIAELLGHTGGFDDTIVPDPVFAYVDTAATTFGAAPPATPELLIKYMLGNPLQHDPGTTYAYSNFGFLTLGYIIERVSGEPYAKYIQDNIFTPAGIVRTQPGASLLSGRLPYEVEYYDYPGAPLYPSVIPPIGAQVPFPYGGYSNELILANGGWVSSPMDIIRYTNNINGQTTPAILTDAPSGFVGYVPPVGQGYQYVFYGSLPGTNSLVHLITDGSTVGNVTYSAIFNTRAGGGEFEPEQDADNAILAFLKTVQSYPSGDLFSVYQGTGTSCKFTLAFPSVSVSSAAGNGVVGLNDANYCAWSAVSNNDWIHITGGALNSDTGGISYTVDANTGAARTGTITAADQTYTINQAGPATSPNPTTLDLSANPTSITAGQSVTLKATLTADQIVAVTHPNAASHSKAKPMNAGDGESITFYNGTTSLGTGTLANGVATLTTTTLPVGTDNISASYAGDTTLAASSSPSIAVTVAASTLQADELALTASPTTAAAGANVALTAQLIEVISLVKPRGQHHAQPQDEPGADGEVITFSMGSTVLGTAKMTSRVATLNLTTLPVGTDSIVATYPGDSTSQPATSMATTVTITGSAPAGTNIMLFATPTTAAAGASVSLDAELDTLQTNIAKAHRVHPEDITSTNGETVTFSLGTTVLGTAKLNDADAVLALTSLPVGTDVITASYPGDTNYAASKGTVTVTITGAAPQSTSLTVTPTPSTAASGASVSIAADLGAVVAQVKAHRAQPEDITSTNGETVTFSIGSTVLGTAKLSNGVATFATTALPVGTDTVTASYAGDTNYGASSGTTTVTITGTTTSPATVTLGTLSATYDGTAHAVTATTSPAGLAVSVTYAGSATAPTNAGSYAVVATVTDPKYTGAATGTLVIAKAAATVTLSDLTATADGNTHAVTVVTVPAGLATSITYAGSATAPSAAGSYAVVATVTDPNYTGSASGTLVISGAPVAADFTIAATGTTNQTIQATGSASYGFSLAPTAAGPYPGAVGFSVNGLPSGFIATFTPSTLAATSGAQTVTMTVSPGTLVAGNQRSAGSKSIPPGLLPSALALMLLPLAGFRKLRLLSRTRLLSLVLLLTGLAGAATLTGCGAGEGFSTKTTKTYTLTVTASAGTVQHSAKVTLDVQ